MRRLRLVGIGMAVLLLVVLALGWALLGTTRGARFTLDRFLPAGTQVGAVEGRLWGSLVLHDVRYDAPGVEATVARVRVAWRPIRLFGRTLDVTSLDVDTVRVTLRETEPAPDSGDAGMIRLTVPLGIELRRLGVRDVRVVTAAGDTAAVASFTGALTARADSFVLDSLRLGGLTFQGSRFSLDADGRLVTGAVAERDTAALTVAWEGELADGRRVAGRGGITGGDGRFEMEQTVSEPAPATLVATVRNAWVPDSLRWTLVVDVPRTALASFQAELPGEAGLRADASGDLRSAEAGIDVRGSYPDLGPAALTGRLGYRDGTLTIDTMELHRTGGPGEARGAGRITFQEDGPAGELRLAWRDLGWPLDSAAFRSPRGTLEVAGGVEGDRVAVTFRGSGEVEGSGGLEFDGGGSYAADPGLLRLDTLTLRLPEGDGWLAGRGVADLSGPQPVVDARVAWRDLGWPLDDAAYWSDDGELRVEGRGGALRVVADAHLGGAGLPDGRWRVVGQGDPSARFAVDSLHGALLGGRVEGAGVIRIDQGPAWELTLRGDSLDPGTWRPEWPGRLAFELETDGRITDRGPVFDLRLDRLDGRLRGRGVAAAVTASGTGPDIAVDTLWLRSGKATIEAAGAVGDSVDVTWAVDAGSLADLAPGVEGRLTAEGRATGTVGAPLVAFTAEGDDVAAAGWTVRRLAARGTIAAGAGSAGSDAVQARDPIAAAGDTVGAGDPGDGQSSLELHLAGVAGPALAVDSVTVNARGTLADHAVTLVALAPADTLEARVAGGLVDGRWGGTLERLDLRSAVAGSWGLRSAAALTVAPDSGGVDALCWVGSGELCVEATWGDAGVRWSGSGRALPMAFFGPALPPGLTVRGEFAVETEGEAGPGLVPTGTFRLTGEPGEVRYARGGGDVPQPYDGFSIDAESDSAGVHAAGELLLGARGSVRAEATLPGGVPLADRDLRGSLHARIEDDGLVSGFVAALNESQGTASVELDVTGTVDAPVVRGTASLTGVEADVVPAGIRLRDGELNARSTDAGRWEVDGGVRSDTGRLTIAGTLRPPTADSVWRADVEVGGDRFRAVQTPELLLTVSPRLGVHATADSVRVDGEVRVPRGRLVLEQLEGTVSESPDVVIVGADSETATADTATGPATVRADVRLVLGDSVRIDAVGLTGRLDGELTVVARPGRPVVGRGELEIHEGRYRIYRQTFDIERGRLLYASTPIADPGLDLRITRQSDEVLAGMEVTGRASDPRVELFSEPSLADDEILAYLVVGRPLRRLSQSEGGQVQNMARSVGVAGGNLVLARLGSVFGLEQARIEQTTVREGEETTRATSLVLGRRILPRVHLDYVIGLSGTANVLRLRYMITDHWIFQTENGQETGADLLYTFGR